MAARCRDRAPRDRNKEPLLKRMPVKYAPVNKFSTKLSPFYLGGFICIAGALRRYLFSESSKRRCPSPQPTGFGIPYALRPAS